MIYWLSKRVRLGHGYIYSWNEKGSSFTMGEVRGQRRASWTQTQLDNLKELVNFKTSMIHVLRFVPLMGLLDKCQRLLIIWRLIIFSFLCNRLMLPAECVIQLSPIKYYEIPLEAYSFQNCIIPALLNVSTVPHILGTDNRWASKERKIETILKKNVLIDCWHHAMWQCSLTLRLNSKPFWNNV